MAYEADGKDGKDVVGTLLDGGAKASLGQNFPGALIGRTEFDVSFVGYFCLRPSPHPP